MIIIAIVGKQWIKRKNKKKLEVSENDGIEKCGQCKFCGKPATKERYPSPQIITKMKKLDLEPSFAELQIVKVCDDCLAIAGSFRSSKWENLDMCVLNSNIMKIEN